MDEVHLGDTNVNDSERLFLNEVVKETINDISTKSLAVKSVAHDVAPIIIDKIFETSSDIVILESDEKDLDHFRQLIRDNISRLNTVHFYSPYKLEEQSSKVRYYHVSNDDIGKLFKKDIRGVVVGDNERFIWERHANLPSFSRFTEAIRSIFSSDKIEDIDRDSRHFQTVANFSDPQTANELVGSLKNIIK